MNILLGFTSLEIGGASLHLVELGNFLAEQGHTVYIISDRGILRDKIKGAIYINLPLKKLKPEILWNPINFFLLIKSILKVFLLIRLKKINLIHVHEIMIGSICYWSRFRLNIPIIFSCHGVSDERKKMYVKRAGLIGDYFIGVSRNTKNLLMQGVKGKEIEQINYGIQKHRLSNYKKEAMTIRENILHKSKSLKIIITLARFEKQKGHRYLLDAIPKIIQKNKNVSFLLVGSGSLLKQMQEQAKLKNLQNKVFFVGEKENPYPYLLASDIFCLPSVFEALPLSIIEAYRASLPVVATDVGGVSEIVKNGITGFLVEPRNPQKLADALLLLLTSKCIDKIKKNAFLYGNSPYFDSDNVHKKIEKFYKKCVKKYTK